MPIDTKHPLYKIHLGQWVRVRDVIAGEDAVKSKSTRYLPMLDGHDSTQYNSFKQRANFHPATTRALSGLTGAIFLKSPAADYPPGFEGFTANVDLVGTDIVNYAKKTTGDVIAVGRCGTLVDYSEEDDSAYFVHYKAEQIINWRQTRFPGSDKLELTMVVLKEHSLKVDEDDRFKAEPVERWRVLNLGIDEDGNRIYFQEVYEKHRNKNGSEDLAKIGGTIVPTRRGDPLTFIPFTFFGPTDLSVNPEMPPLLPLVNVNLSHYRSSADYEHGAHYTALPTLVISGEIQGDDKKKSKIMLGPQTAILLGENGKAEMLEYKGQGLDAIKEMLESKEQQMAVLGARMLENQKPVVESADAISQRHRGENSLLSSISDTVSRGLRRCMEWAYWWNGADTAQDIKFELNRDFLPGAMTGTDVVALVDAWMKGGMGMEALHYNLQKGERLPDGMDFEKFQEDIENTGPAGMFVGELDENIQ